MHDREIGDVHRAAPALAVAVVLAEECAQPHRAELENLAQYILRHSFSVEKMTHLAQTGRVIYHSRLVEQDPVIERILRHLDLWEEPARSTDRGPPETASAADREPFTDDLPFGPDTCAE